MKTCNLNLDSVLQSVQLPSSQMYSMHLSLLDKTALRSFWLLQVTFIQVVKTFILTILLSSILGHQSIILFVFWQNRLTTVWAVRVTCPPTRFKTSLYFQLKFLTHLRKTTGLKRSTHLDQNFLVKILNQNFRCVWFLTISSILFVLENRF